MITVARFMAVFCLLMVPAHAVMFDGHPLVTLAFAALDIAAAVSWRLCARRRRPTATPSTGRTPS